MGVAATQIGLDHEAGDLLGVTGRKPGSFESAPREGSERIRRHARGLR